MYRIASDSRSRSCADIDTRHHWHPWLWLQEVTSNDLHLRHHDWRRGGDAGRNDHLYLDRFAGIDAWRAARVAEVVIRLGGSRSPLCPHLFRHMSISPCAALGSLPLPSKHPIASLYAAIPIAGVLIALFADLNRSSTHPQTARSSGTGRAGIHRGLWRL